MFRVGLLTCVSLLWCLAVQAQTQAACGFSFFSPRTQFTLHNGTPIFMLPLGINDFGTIVGVANPGTAHGLIRWSNGGVIAVKGTTLLTGRSDHGTSVGYDLTDQGVQVEDHTITNDHTITPIVLDVNNGGVFEVKGINNWGTTIGRYAPPNHFGAHGFKRWRNGTTHTLDFPGAQPGSTEPDAINDNGTVVGSYFAADDSVHGFIFNNGQWATLDYPNASATVLVGITNTDAIVGNAFVNASTTPFLYKNGTFKIIAIPNSDPGTRGLLSISPKLGLILGVTDARTGKPAFVAHCQ